MTVAAASRMHAPAEHEAVNPWTVGVVVSIATFMEVLDTSIANVAIPHIAGGTASTEEEATWVLTSYLIANAVILPASGWLSTIIGRKRFYMTCVALFTISSFLCGIAPNLGVLIVCRVLQGIGGGGLAPSEQAILADTFEPKKRGMAFAMYGVVVVVAPAIGPTFGGWITDNFSWRWIFFINVPIGLLSLGLSHLVVSDPPDLVAERKRRLRAGLRIDYVGFGLLALGLGCLQVVLDKGQEDDWFGSTFITCMAIAAVFGIVVGLLWECKTSQPLLDIPMMKDRTFAVSVVVMFAIGVVLFGTTVMLPLFAQTMLGYTAELAGLVITPGGFFVMALMPVVGFLVNRVAARYLVAVGLILSCLSIHHMANFDLNVSYSTLAWARVYQSSGLAFLFIPINTAAYSELPRNKSNDASALMNLARNLGGSVGISAASTLLTRRAQFHQNVLASHVTPFNALVQQAAHGASTLFAAHGGSAPAYAMLQGRRMLYQLVQQQAQMLAYIDVFWALSVACACMIPLVFLMKNNKPGEAPAGH